MMASDKERRTAHVYTPLDKRALQQTRKSISGNFAHHQFCKKRVSEERAERLARQTIHCLPHTLSAKYQKRLWSLLGSASTALEESRVNVYTVQDLFVSPDIMPSFTYVKVPADDAEPITEETLTYTDDQLVQCLTEHLQAYFRLKGGQKGDKAIFRQQVSFIWDNSTEMVGLQRSKLCAG